MKNVRDFPNRESLFLYRLAGISLKWLPSKVADSPCNNHYIGLFFYLKDALIATIVTFVIGNKVLKSIATDVNQIDLAAYCYRWSDA